MTGLLSVHSHLWRGVFQSKPHQFSPPNTCTFPLPVLRLGPEAVNLGLGHSQWGLQGPAELSIIAILTLFSLSKVHVPSFLCDLHRSFSRICLEFEATCIAFSGLCADLFSSGQVSGVRRVDDLYHSVAIGQSLKKRHPPRPAPRLAAHLEEDGKAFPKTCTPLLTPLLTTVLTTVLTTLLTTVLTTVTTRSNASHQKKRRKVPSGERLSSAGD